MTILNARKISIIEFTGRLFKSGGISIKGFFLLFYYYTQLIISIPFEIIQHLTFGKRLRQTENIEDPIFILGHYRCGTSLLQKLLASDKRFGVLTYYDALFPNSNLIFGKHFMRFIQWIINSLKIKNPFFHNNILQLSDPDEEDDFQMNKASFCSAYWGMIYPKKWKEWLNCNAQLSDPLYRKNWMKEYHQLIKYLTYKNKGIQLVLKSPPNTERVNILLKLYPNAKFVYIYRNPYHLYFSIRNMWEKVILKYYSLQHLSKEELNEIIFEHLIYLTNRYEEDKLSIHKGNLIEISYEELKKDPFQNIKKIYSTLHLPDFRTTENDLILQLEDEKKYKPFNHDYNLEELELIESRWGHYINKWGYKPPAS